MKKLIALLALFGACSLAAPAIAQDKPAAPAAEAKPAEAAPAAPAAAAPAAPAAAPAAAAPAAAPAAPTTPELVDVAKINSGDTAWMLTSTALVLLMTIPGLALFYGGMVRKKNVLATLMQSFAITCLVTVLWVIAGYSLAFMPGSEYIGGMGRFFLSGMSFMKEAEQGHREPPRCHHSRVGVHDVPDDFRHHHPGADHRRLRRPHEILGDAVVHGAVVPARLLADRPHGCGSRPASSRPWGYSTSPAARWCISTPVLRRWCAPWCWASASATAKRRWRRTTWC